VWASGEVLVVRGWSVELTGRKPQETHRGAGTIPWGPAAGALGHGVEMMRRPRAVPTACV
jgi:hypothetical protein